MNGKESSSYAAALYLRLSRDDEGAGDSASIVSQREILTRYARERDFPVYGEYVDDGWSGTNFDRPAFKRMLEDIEAGRVNLVLTKDLSRLGRDYIETGRYTEIYFPSRRVRYIAVNDGYDSENPDSDIAPFRNVINEMYARDTSRKIRSAFAARMQSGAFIGNFAPYGYRKDPADRHHLIPHGQTAPVVQRIFRMAAEGWTPSWIARELSGEGIPPPAVQRLLDRGGEAPFPQREWTAASVARIVRNVVYLGHMAQGKTTRLSFKSGVTVRNPTAEWVVVKDTHAPLVGQEEFERVGRRLSGRTYTGRGEFRNLFSGLARCADCGKGMSTVGTRRREGEADLACGGYKGNGKGACTNHFIAYESLYRLVQEGLREAACLGGEERRRLLEELTEVFVPEGEGARARERDALRAQEARLDDIIGKLYLDRAEGRINEGRFRRLLARFETKGREIAARIARAERPASPDPTGGRGPLERANALLDFPELTEGLLWKLIDHIEIGQGCYEKTEQGRVKHQRVRLTFRFPLEGRTEKIEFGAINNNKEPK